MTPVNELKVWTSLVRSINQKTSGRKGSPITLLFYCLSFHFHKVFHFHRKGGAVDSSQEETLLQTFCTVGLFREEKSNKLSSDNKSGICSFSPACVHFHFGLSHFILS